MKYGKYWKSWICSQDNSIQQHCIQYIKWKKDITHNPEKIKKNWKKMLYSDCKNVDMYVFPLINCNSCFNLNKKVVLNDNKTRLQLCEQNQTTLYKICKKIQKRLNIPALKFYNDLLKAHIYDFTGSAQRTALSLETNDKIDCLTCKNEQKDNKFIIMRCGHIIHKSCAFKLWNITPSDNTRKDRYHLEKKSFEVNCPYCNEPVPCHPNLGSIIITK